MIKLSSNSRECQQHRLNVKSLSHQMENLAVQGAGLSPWEAKVLVQSIEEVYFSNPLLQQAAHGQMKYLCVEMSEPAGKKIEDCQMVTVLLTVHDQQDEQESQLYGTPPATSVRHRRLLRMTDEAREQGGLLSQEDLARILMCDSRTIRRDIKSLRKKEIIVPTRGQVCDIGPGVTHRGIAVRLWLEGKEPVEVARHINHSLAAVEKYLEMFKRVAFLRQKHFDDFQIALTAGISVAAARTYVGLYKEFSHKSFFKQRIAEINLIGAKHYIAQDEKKDSTSSNALPNEGRSK